MIKRHLMSIMRIQGKLKYLLVSLILLVLFYPFFEQGQLMLTILNILFSAVLLSSLYVVSYDKSHFAAGIVLMLPALVTNWLHPTIANTFLSHLFGIAFYLYVIWVLLTYIMKVSNVTSDLIFGAISLYLLIGITFAAVFSLVESIYPGSFNTSSSRLSELFYFSFSTITTMGYGDIVPTSSLTRSLSIIEAVIGQMYMYVLIAKLVGLYVFQKTKE